MANISGAIVVMDFDDVLVDLSSLVFARIRENFRIFSRWLVDTGPLTKEQLNQRPIFSFSEWLLKKEFINKTSREYLKEQLIYHSESAKYIFTDDLYDLATPTEFAKRTIMNPLYIDSAHVKKVYILSRNVTKEQDASKKRFIEKYFKHEKVEYISLDLTQEKGPKLKELNINWNLFVDDELPNIRSVAETADSLEKKEFLIPEYGYNKMDESLDLLIKGKDAIYTYYKP